MVGSTTMSRAVVAVTAGVLLVVLAACTATPAGPSGGKPDAVVRPERNPAFPQFSTDPDVPVVPNLVYGTSSDGSRLLLDVCLPPGDTTGTAPATGQTQAPSTDAPGASGEGGGAATPDPGASATPGSGSSRSDSTPAPDDRTATPDSRSGARAGVLMVHGGSWERGDKSTIAYRSVCQWLAKSTGAVIFNADYRLAPAHPYPAAIDDLQTAVEWMRQPTQQRRFDIDPDRIGAFGGSAGGNLVSLLGTEGRGRLDVGSRVAAVVELSGPVDVTGDNMAPALRSAQLSYLGCSSFRDCRSADQASAGNWIDRTDPPFLVGHSTKEFIPLAQSADFVARLRAKGIRAIFIETVGTNHSIGQLSGNPRLRARIADFLRTTLAID